MFTSRDNLTYRPASILLVDDDPTVLRLLARLLEQEGHKIRTATDGNMALQYIMQECPDVIITDWRMPGIDGLDLCRRVRQLHKCKVLKHYSYILVLSAQSGKESLLEGLDAGADDFVEKGGGDISNLRVELLIRLKAALRTREMERDLEYAAKYDALTSLLNRCTFFEEGAQLWTKSLQHDQTLSAVMMDCDFFKRINDQHGHQAGDVALKTLAQILQRHSRGYDMICRYGGEEFCALLPGCDEKVAFHWTERIRKQLENQTFFHENKALRFTASFGVAERVADVTNLDQLMERADQALLFAKETGRNRSACYSETLLDQGKSNTFHGMMSTIFEGATARDVMTPIVLTVPISESAANVADFFLKARVESLVVVDQNDEFFGLISEKNFLSLVGDQKRWNDSIRDMVTPNVVTYTPDTPLKVIYNFLSRVSIRRVMIIDGKKPIGFIGRNLLLRWLRNSWIIQMQSLEGIVPRENTPLLSVDELNVQFHQLLNELEGLSERLDQHEKRSELSFDTSERVRNEVIAGISKSQDMMDQLLMVVVGYHTDGQPNGQHIAAGLDEQTGYTDHEIFSHGLF